MTRFYPLYIDPGTGSMLFSVLIGAAATLYFVARAVILRLKVFFSGGGRVSVQRGEAPPPCLVYCEGPQYCSVFKPVLDEFEARAAPVVYWTGAEDDPVFQAGYRHIKPEFIGEGNRAFARLNFARAGVVLMTTPGLDVYQLKRSKTVRHYAHILHAPSDATMYRLFGIDYFDSVLLTGDYQGADIRTLERQRGLPEKRLVTVGCAYLDVLAEKLRGIPPEERHQFTVLVSPSWGPSALLANYGERLLDPLAATGWNIIVRPHPQSRRSEAALLERLRLRYEKTENLVWNFERDNIASLARADVMISDFSGIIYDYMFLRDKPVMYVNAGLDLRPYDAWDLGPDAARKLWQFAALQKAGLELREDMFANIAEVIRGAADSAELRAARREAREVAWMYPGEAGKRTVDFLLETARAVEESHA